MDATRLFVCTALLTVSLTTGALADMVKVGVLAPFSGPFVRLSTSLRERPDILERAIGLKKTDDKTTPTAGPMH